MGRFVNSHYNDKRAARALVCPASQRTKAVVGEVVLVNMPFFHVRWPNLGLSLLAAALKRRGIGARVAYLNFDLAEHIGLDSYLWIADQFAFVLGGERLFARVYFGNRLPEDERYWREVLLRADPGLDEEDRREFERVGRCLEPFLDHCLEAVDWQRYEIVGFSASLQQTLASLCLARRIKQLRPQTTIVLGGAACEGPMGRELLRWFAELDFVCSGEADLSFPLLVEKLLGGLVTGSLPPGVWGRQEKPRDTGPRRPAEPREESPQSSLPTARLAADACGGTSDESLPRADEPACVAMVDDLDALPYPELGDYFARLERSGLREQIDPLLFFEASRGCWWGQKHQCSFCGLNGARLRYRSKSPTRVLDELRELVGRYGVRRIAWADNVFDRRYFRTLLPMLKEAALGVKFECELRTDLRPAQARLLLEAGLGAAQLGIETFETELLELAGKGLTAIDNIQTLKWFSEAGIEVKWNLLYGFPGEKPEHYLRLAELLPSLFHLAPPIAVGRVRIDRFAPYFQCPEAFGLGKLRAHRAFRFVWALPGAAVDRLAYYFEGEGAAGPEPEQYAQPVLALAQRWQQLAGTATLRYWDRPDGVLLLTDTRPDAESFQHRLNGWQREVYLFCDPARTREQIMQFATQQTTPPRPQESQVETALEQWTRARLMVGVDGHHFSLALRAES